MFMFAFISASVTFSFMLNYGHISSNRRGSEKRSRRTSAIHLGRNQHNADKIIVNTVDPMKHIDYEALKSDDPLFLDMPWPSESGPGSAAFARHMQWKRQLNDGESALTFQLYAVYYVL